MKTLNKLIAFLKNPYQAEEFKNITAKEFFSLLLLSIIMIIPIIAVGVLIGIDDMDHLIIQLWEENRWLVVFMAIVIAPLMEEPLFRLHLVLKKSYIYWGMGLSIFFLSYPVILLWIYFIYLLVNLNRGVQTNLKFVVFTSSALFALVHIGNYPGFDYAQYFYLIPVLVGAQFIIGLVLSYIRLIYGMKWAILFHAFYNAIIVLTALLFYNP